MNDISIIIPILNEKSSLNKLLLGIYKQNFLPKEIIFIDSGSQDGSIDIIEKFKLNHNKIDIKIYTNPLGYPGGNRNYGVKRAKYSWIVFLDAGIEPEKYWLEELIKYKDTKNLNAVFGVCNFNGNTSLQKAFCAISHGCGTERIFLASSLFHISIFNKIGYFDENLRASEDLIWISNFKKFYKRIPVCNTAKVNYREYPSSFNEFITKYYIYEIHSIKSKIVSKKQILFNFLILIITIIMFMSIPRFTFFFIVLQFIIRAFLTPISRSLNFKWWNTSISSIFLAIPALICRDLSKFIARIISI